ncbi:hypothetical protein JOF29_003120 [Kribbella aluminosa]|uniref:Gas vesicle protein GvpA/GvpJ/GvpM family n=1 Tax=Kribbella aluminosa TaxID=416017 RepID=A0ABS4UK58_9ACTN|nr:gas vesicle protein [Kribbella aluminosa]MBP2352037.1 hypothetical protein [Kribbella aluminosa]
MREIALVDLLDRLLGSGVVLAGDIVISLADVDLVEIRLAALIRTITQASTETSTDTSTETSTGSITGEPAR